VWDSVIPDRVSPSPACLLLVSDPSRVGSQQRDAHEMKRSFRICESNSNETIRLNMTMRMVTTLVKVPVGIITHS
jgi:hypothetical protein